MNMKEKLPSPYFSAVQLGTETNTEIFKFFKIFHIKYPAFLFWPLQLLIAKKSLNSFISSLKSLERRLSSTLDWELCDCATSVLIALESNTPLHCVPGYATKLNNKETAFYFSKLIRFKN